MTKYYVEIAENLQKIIIVKAKSEDEALEKVRRDYRKSEHVLTADDFTEVEFKVVKTEYEEDVKCLKAA